MNLTAYNSLMKPVPADELISRKIDKSKLIDLGNGEYKYDGDLNLSKLGITSLKDIPYNIVEITGTFDCSDNKLTTLEGAPEEVGGGFDCSYNKLTTLEASPKKVGSGSFDCSNNKLTTLEGAPKEVAGNFYCSDNKLTTLVGAPKKVGGNFGCYVNPTKFTEEYVRSLCDVGRGVYV